MPTLRQLRTGFMGGELDPMLVGRSETGQYAYGLEICENFLPTSEGPLVKRPGFAMIRGAALSSTWLGTFKFSVTQEYVIEWLETKARFFTNGGRIESDPVTPYEVTTPYAASEASALSTQQNFDRLYIDHPNHPPAALRRDTATTFTHEESELLEGPFQDINTDETITVTASGTAVGASITLTASSAIFEAGHVGSLFYLEAKDFSDVNPWEPGMKGISAGQYCRNDGKVYQQVLGTVTGQIQPTHSRGAEWDGLNKQDELNSLGPYGVKWNYVHDRFGICEITAIGGGGTTATATVKKRLPNSLTSVASFRWAHALFSDYEGYPGLVSLFKGRLIHIKDFDIVGSVVGDYGGGRVNFATYTDSGTLADDLAFRRRLSMDNPPLWMRGTKDRLLVGSADAEFAIGPVNNSAAFSGTNITSDEQSYYGSEAVFPVKAGTDIVFVSRGARRVRAADYDFGRDRYDAPDLTAAARQVSKSGIIQLAVQHNPWPVLYGVRSDGELAMHARSRLEIKGWARTVLGGGARVLSAVSIVGDDGQTDELWLLVEREDGSAATVKEIWQQAAWRELGDAQDEQFYVDGGVRIDATAGQTSFTGLDHLAGQEVAVLANGGVVPGLSVSSGGELTLPAASVPQDSTFVVIVGLAYTARAVTLPVAGEINGVPIQGLKKRLVRLATRVLETIGIKISAPGDESPYEIIDRAGDDAMDAPIPLFTGEAGGEIEADVDRDGRAIWLSEDPLAAIVTSAALKLDVDTKDV